jgi:hypothetical protein
MSNGPYATIGLSIVEPSGPDAEMHVRAWQIPLAMAEDFAEAMGARFGQAAEMITRPEVMAEGAERTAREDGAVFMFDGEARHG